MEKEENSCIKQKVECRLVNKEIKLQGALDTSMLLCQPAASPSWVPALASQAPALVKFFSPQAPSSPSPHFSLVTFFSCLHFTCLPSLLIPQISTQPFQLCSLRCLWLPVSGLSCSHLRFLSAQVALIRPPHILIAYSVISPSCALASSPVHPEALFSLEFLLLSTVPWSEQELINSFLEHDL